MTNLSISPAIATRIMVQLKAEKERRIGSGSVSNSDPLTPEGIHAGKSYTFPMPSRIVVHLKDFSKPAVLEKGISVGEDSSKEWLEIKNAAGELIGSYRKECIVGWGVDSEPMDLKNLSTHDLALLIGELAKIGIADDLTPPDAEGPSPEPNPQSTITDSSRPQPSPESRRGSGES